MKTTAQVFRMNAIFHQPARAVQVRCLECERKITKRSRYTFFCSKGCAADWGDDEARMQYLKIRAKKKKKL